MPRFCLFCNFTRFCRALQPPPLDSVDLAPNSVLDINFSLPPKTLRIQRASDDELENFVELADVSDGQIISPSAPGLYLYQVEAGFGWRGSVRYFFMVRVQQSV